MRGPEIETRGEGHRAGDIADQLAIFEESLGGGNVPHDVFRLRAPGAHDEHPGDDDERRDSHTSHDDLRQDPGFHEG